MPSENVSMGSLNFYLNLAMGELEPEPPFAQWQQGSDRNGVTEAPHTEDEDYEADDESLGSANKENDASLLPANLPEPGTRQRRPQPQPQPQPQHSGYGRAPYRLGPRKKVKLTDPELDFKIFEDETASVGAPFKWEYYGSGVPALGELKNNERFEYTVEHQIRRQYYQLLDQSVRTGDDDLFNLVERVRDQRYTTWQRFSGATEWTAGCNPMDVWLWVEDKGYHKRWTEHQVVQFKEFLQFMKTCILNACRMADPDAAMAMDMWNETLIKSRFKLLQLPNLHMVKNSEVRVSFMPNGPDEKLLYRADFTPAELKILDAGWQGPGRWAPGEERGEADESGVSSTEGVYGDTTDEDAEETGVSSTESVFGDTTEVDTEESGVSSTESVFGDTTEDEEEEKSEREWADYAFDDGAEGFANVGDGDTDRE
ncbi:hypothetical protein CCMA1212_006503 [Trichoderma ghanense]|uniref:Uncharacterized protein n=1 Tax=Trichoderma ghanense TaxID=65468 RepID=A0ABY2H0Q9_9HYPO